MQQNTAGKYRFGSVRAAKSEPSRGISVVSLPAKPLVGKPIVLPLITRMGLVRLANSDVFFFLINLLFLNSCIFTEKFQKIVQSSQALHIQFPLLLASSSVMNIVYLLQLMNLDMLLLTKTNKLLNC